MGTASQIDTTANGREAHFSVRVSQQSNVVEDVETAICELSFVTFEPMKPPGKIYQILKRTFDIAASSTALILFAPVFVSIAFVIKCTSPDVPVFFGVEVIGRNGRPFRMWKFSTMIRDAHLVLADLLESSPELKREWEEAFKLKTDPRILPFVGRFLRKTSLNELPQLWNVIVGEMSIVAPRPITVSEEELYLRLGGIEVLRARHAQAPGLTGLWQATGRSDVTYEQRVTMDVEYLRKQSFLRDIRIIGWTVSRVLSGQGAV